MSTDASTKDVGGVLTPEQAGVVAALRRDAYTLLAGLLADPAGDDVLDHLTSDEVRALLDPFDVGDALSRLTTDAQSVPSQVLRQEFFDLFVVPGRHFVAPSQSVYLDARNIEGETVRGLTMGESAVSVAGAYAAYGLEQDTARPIQPDNVAVELAFLARVAAQESDAWERNDFATAQRQQAAGLRFVSSNLGRWLPQLRAKLKEKASHSFYPALLDLACELARADEEYLRGQLA